jgi:uncharacterized RDD family membrane protein YckC
MTSENSQRWAGDRLGLPEKGPGSLAGMPRRILAIFLDWGIAWLFSIAFFSGSNDFTLLAFGVMQWLLIATLGYSVGMRICSIAVRRLDGQWNGFWRSLIRTCLLLLVIPVAVWDADNRGLHDKAAGTVLVRA